MNKEVHLEELVCGQKSSENMSKRYIMHYLKTYDKRQKHFIEMISNSEIDNFTKRKEQVLNGGRRG